jgi:8-oxo-dGTP pyrophosphatase MutT (NUDIX family)
MENLPVEFVVGAYIIRDDQVLLVDHRKLGMWIGLGGHVDPGEDPVQALLREIREEAGLEVEIVGPVTQVAADPRHKPLAVPRFMDRHEIDGKHQHVCLYYVCRIVSGEVTLKADEHHAIKWFAVEDLADPRVSRAAQVYATIAIEEMKAHG